MNALTFFIMMLISLNAYSEGSIDAPGKVFYKLPDQSIVKRDVVLSVPSRGEGKVFLKQGRIHVEAEKFFSREINGRTVFYVIFDQYPGQSSEDESLVYRGTYTRGTNLALYYGDVFKINRALSSENEVHFELSATDNNFSSKHVAGFYFKYEIE
ncbi:MAG: hypothetical protein AB8G05_00050 [Oligoflexales bacterium]